jgi:hypothetical protein
MASRHMQSIVFYMMKLCFSFDRYMTCVLSIVYKNYNLLLIGVVQRVTGDLMRVSVGTSCAIIHKVSAIFASLMKTFVKFPVYSLREHSSSPRGITAGTRGITAGTGSLLKNAAGLPR